MNTPPETSGSKPPLSIGEKASLLSKVQIILRHVPAATQSLSSRSKLMTHVNKLTEHMLTLNLEDAFWLQERAIMRALGIHDWDALTVACEGFALTVEGKPIVKAAAPVHAPADLDHTHHVNGKTDAARADAAQAAPIGAALVAVAEPEQDPDVTARAPAGPDRDHADANDQATAAPAGLATVEQLGEAVRLARIGKRMTQQQAASVAGVGRRFVIELERGKATAEIGCVLAVCHAVGIALIPTLA